MNFGQFLGFLSFLISLYILWDIRQLLLLIFFAVIFAVALNRLVVRLKRFNFSRKLAILSVLISLIFLLNVLLLILFPPFIEQFQLLLSILPRVPDKILEVINNIDYSQYNYLNFWLSLEDLVADINFIPNNLIDNFIAVFSNVFFVLFQVIFVITLTVIFLLNPRKYRRYFLKLFPSFYRYRIDEILDKSEIAIVSWLSGILISSVFIGMLSGLGLFVLQVKLVLVHALLAGLLNIIPNIGPAASVVFPIMIAVVDSPWKIVPILIWYFIVQNLESYWLTPKIMAEKVSLLPAVTLFAQIFFATIFGLLGLLLALPLTVVCKTWIEEILFKDILDRWESAS